MMKINKYLISMVLMASPFPLLLAEDAPEGDIDTSSLLEESDKKPADAKKDDEPVLDFESTDDSTSKKETSPPAAAAAAPAVEPAPPPAAPIDNKTADGDLQLGATEGPKKEETKKTKHAKSSLGNINPTFQPLNLEFKGASLREVIRAISNETHVNFILPDRINTSKLYLNLKNVPWDEALEAILKTNSLAMIRMKGNVIRIDTVENLAREAQETARNRQSLDLIKPTKVLVVRLSYAKVKDAIALVRTMLRSNFPDNRIKVESDERTNSVIVEATPNDLSKVRSLIERVDLQTPQVKIESRVIEVLKSSNNFLGINWGGPLNYDQGHGLGFGNMMFPSNIVSAFSVDTGARAHDDGGRLDVHVGSLNNSVALDLRLRMAELANQTRNLQNNSVLVVDQEKAVIEAGQEDFFQVPMGDGQTALSSVKYSISLEVTPRINSDGTVQMSIKIENSTPTTAAPQASASKSMRTLTTNLLRKSGETAVIGGLYTTSLVETKQGIPYLSDIPLIGWLFRSAGKTDNRRELIIMVTPTVVVGLPRKANDKLSSNFGSSSNDIPANDSSANDGAADASAPDTDNSKNTETPDEELKL